MYEKYIVEKNKKYIRLSLKDMTLEDLYSVIIDSSFSCCFIVFKRDDYFERFKLAKPYDKEDFLNRIEGVLFNREDSGVDSDSFNIYDAEFIDCYPM